MRLEGEPLTFLVILAIATVHAFWQGRLYRKVQELRFDYWVRLSSPSLTKVGIGRKFSYFRLVWFGGYAELEEPEIARMCIVLRCIDVTTLLLAAVTVIVRQTVVISDLQALCRSPDHLGVPHLVTSSREFVLHHAETNVHSPSRCDGTWGR